MSGGKEAVGDDECAQDLFMGSCRDPRL